VVFCFERLSFDEFGANESNCSKVQAESIMAKSQHTFMKRQREIDKKKKATEKREKREDKKNNPTTSSTDLDGYIVNHGVVINSIKESDLDEDKKA
jgi:hypothetical protein